MGWVILRTPLCISCLNFFLLLALVQLALVLTLVQLALVLVLLGREGGPIDPSLVRQSQNDDRFSILSLLVHPLCRRYLPHQQVLSNHCEGG